MASTTTKKAGENKISNGNKPSSLAFRTSILITGNTLDTSSGEDLNTKILNHLLNS